jgi:hypothetical protein
MDQTLSKPTVELTTQTQSFILADASQTLNLPNTVSQEINTPRPANPKSHTIYQTQIQEIPPNPLTRCQNTNRHFSAWQQYYYVTTFFVLLMFVFSLPNTQSFIKKFINSNLKVWNQWADVNYWEFNIIAMAGLMINICLVLPGKSLIMISVGLITKSVWRAAMINFIGNQISICLLFGLVRFGFRKRFLLAYAENENFIVFNSLVKANPWRASFLSWSVFVIVGVKAILLS